MHLYNNFHHLAPLPIRFAQPGPSKQNDSNMYMVRFHKPGLLWVGSSSTLSKFQRQKFRVSSKEYLYYVVLTEVQINASTGLVLFLHSDIKMVNTDLR